MKLRLFSFLLLAVSVLPSFADDAKVVFKLKAGGETIIELKLNPVITFTSTDLVVTSDITTISIPLDNMDYYTFTNGSTGIESVSVAPQYINGHVVFSGLRQGASVAVHTIDGKLITQLPADASGSVDVSLDSLPKGIYIIGTPDSRIKIINK